MVKKILWTCLIIIVLYILSIFVAPSFADKTAEILHISSFNEFMRNFKTSVDEIYTNLPSETEVKDAYEKVKSWAIDGANKIKDWIDTIREGANEATEKYDEIKDKVDESKEKVDETVETFQEWIDKVKEIDNTISWALQNNN